MINRRAAVISAVLILVMCAAGIWALLIIPAGARVAVHFDAAGHADGWSNGVRAFFTLPVLAAVIWGVMALLPRIDPRGDNLARSAAAYGTLWIAIIAFLCVQQGSLIARSQHIELPVARVHAAMIGALFIVIGNVLGKIRPNYFLGIRTPWTLADEHVWDQTHRFGGWAFVAAGALLLVAGFAAPQATPAAALTLPVILALALGVTVKSYLLWKQHHR
ncbi:MAG TPA: SdpI family protein [Steroidobacteraceae bacterium]|nr:SdpI family protein [Steroidobacteraceae bacterium]